MVLRLKAWESRSPPGLPVGQQLFDILFALTAFGLLEGVVSNILPLHYRLPRDGAAR